VPSVNTESRSTPERYSVFLLAQNRLLREALARVLGKRNISVTGAGALSSASMEQIIAAAPDVLVMDSFTASVSNRELIRGVQLGVPEMKIVMIGMDADEQAFMECVREGALGYVLKDASALEVLATVRAVANGEAACPSKLSASLFRYVARQSHHVPSFQVKMCLGLTSREQQLVGLIGRGLTNKEIAGHLQLAEQTVRNHVHRMLRKVGANDRLAVVEVCRMQGLPV